MPVRAEVAKLPHALCVAVAHLEGGTRRGRDVSGLGLALRAWLGLGLGFGLGLGLGLANPHPNPNQELSLVAADPNLAREGPGLVERFLLQPPAEGREGPLTLTRTRTRTRTLSLT